MNLGSFGLMIVGVVCLFRGNIDPRIVDLVQAALYL